jgi:glycosyl transferase family 25
MHIFVINLPEDAARREAIEKQLHELGLSYDIFPAIRGKLLSPQEKARHYDEKWFVRNEGRPALAGELGCALSHIGVYRLIQERNLSHALILEDDAWLNPNLPQLLEAIDRKHDPDQKNVFLLTWFSAISMGGYKTLWSAYHLAKVKSALCTHGYVVSNAAAGALVDSLYPVRHVADCWDWLRRHGIVDIWAVFPTCITTDLSYETSTTPELARRPIKRPLLKRLARKAYRGFWWFYDRALAMMRRVGK